MSDQRDIPTVDDLRSATITRNIADTVRIMCYILRRVDENMVVLEKIIDQDYPTWHLNHAHDQSNPETYLRDLILWTAKRTHVHLGIQPGFLYEPNNHTKH